MPPASQQRRSQAGSPVSAESRHTSSRVSTIQVDNNSSTRVRTVIVTLAAAKGSHANGLNRIAASGDR